MQAYAYLALGLLGRSMMEVFEGRKDLHSHLSQVLNEILEDLG